MKVAKIIQLWSRIRKDLFGTIDKFTDKDLGYIAFENGYSVGQIILHIAHEEYGEIQYGLTYEINEFPPGFQEEEYQTIDSMKALLASVHNETTKYLETVADDELENDFEQGRTRFSWLRGGYELVTKKRNQVAAEQHHPEATRGGGYELVVFTVTAVTLGTEIHIVVLLQADCLD